MSNKNIHIFIHCYNGSSGIARMRLYLREIITYVSINSLIKSVEIVSCGFSKVEIMNLDEVKELQSLTCINITYLAEAFSEVPTINFMLEKSKSIPNDDWVLYFHIKGSTYSDANTYFSQSKQTLELLLETLHHKSMKFIQQSYSAIGCNFALGVFERFGVPEPHFSGNFFALQAQSLKLAHPIPKDKYAASFRHESERFLSTFIDDDEFFNINADFYIDPLYDSTVLDKRIIRKNLDKIYDINLRNFSEAKIKFVKICQFLRKKHKRYHEGKYITKLLAVMFNNYSKFSLGNNSYLRRSYFLNKCLNYLLPWYSCGLYRYYLLPSTFHILESNNLLIKDQK